MSTRDSLKQALDVAEWEWLKPHVERDAVVLVSEDLDILKVGEEISSNNTQQVEEWIKTGELAKPSLHQITAWGETPNKRFTCLIIQPYVLIQYLPS